MGESPTYSKRWQKHQEEQTNIGDETMTEVTLSVEGISKLVKYAAELEEQIITLKEQLDKRHDGHTAECVWHEGQYELEGGGVYNTCRRCDCGRAEIAKGK